MAAWRYSGWSSMLHAMVLQNKRMFYLARPNGIWRLQQSSWAKAWMDMGCDWNGGADGFLLQLKTNVADPLLASWSIGRYRWRPEDHSGAFEQKSPGVSSILKCEYYWSIVVVTGCLFPACIAKKSFGGSWLHLEAYCPPFFLKNQVHVDRWTSKCATVPFNHFRQSLCTGRLCLQTPDLFHKRKIHCPKLVFHS